MASYFLEAGNLNGGNDGMCSDVAGPSSGGSGDFFDFGSSSRFRTFTISSTASKVLAAILEFSVTTTPILPFEACYVIMHKVKSVVRAKWPIRPELIPVSVA